MINGKKVFLTVMVCSSLLFSGTQVLAANTPSTATSQRLVLFVNNNATSITVRTQPNPTAPQITTQTTGQNLVWTTANEVQTQSGSYSYYQEDYTKSGLGSYSDSYSGWATYSDSTALYQTAANRVKNYTSSPDNFWFYSNLTSAFANTLAPGAYANGGVSAQVFADNTNPSAWLVTYDTSGTLAFVNGWYVNGTL